MREHCGAIWMSFGVKAVISVNANMARNVMSIDMSNFVGGVGLLNEVETMSIAGESHPSLKSFERHVAL
ncbi:WD repeat-containing protein 17 [Frankliniella fusca]|uniref:WD repeat-containing protein 17 n=1 Tax=Frankliniella fusca TaxID=407009 RepID=A0AAE1HC49_9NEOP|nr:WD repeat-containing protein 17 [Frankliniella fusca]